MARKRGKIQGEDTFGIVHQPDWHWIASQDPCVKDLWIDCWKAEKFGESFARLETKVSKNSWTKAKAALSHLFEFRPLQKQSAAGRWQIEGWEVRNLHGSKTGFLSQQIGEKDEANNEPNQTLSSPNGWESKREGLGEESHLMGEQNAVGFDTIGFDSCLLYKQNSSTICNEDTENSSSISRSGCSELAPCTKVAGSAPAPDAKLTREGNPEASLTDLPSSKIHPEHGLVSEPGKQEDDLPVQKMLDQCGEFNTISAAPISPTSEPALEASQNPPDPWDAQSDTLPTEPTLPPRLAPDPAECSRVYITVKQKLSEVGLMKGNSHRCLARFKDELEKGRLARLIEGVRENMEEDATLPPEVLFSDYLLYDPDTFDEPQVCVKRKDGLTLVSWSKL